MPLPVATFLRRLDAAFEEAGYYLIPQETWDKRRALHDTRPPLLVVITKFGSLIAQVLVHRLPYQGKEGRDIARVTLEFPPDTAAKYRAPKDRPDTGLRPARPRQPYVEVEMLGDHPTRAVSGLDSFGWTGGLKHALEALAFK